MITAKDIMTDCVVVADPDDRVEDAINRMLLHEVSGLPVVNSTGQLLGVITEYDILEMVEHCKAGKNKVSQRMTRKPLSIEASTPVTELAAIFRQRSIRRYPVVEDGQLVGIVSRRDLIRLVLEVRSKVRIKRAPSQV